LGHAVLDAPQRLHLGEPETAGQLVQPSVAGLVVAVPVPPPVAVMPVNDGMEKNVLAHARGADSPMEASLVSVTVSGLLALPLAATVSAVVNVWLLPLVVVESFHVTSLGVEATQPVCVVVNAFVV
jgi:hypothetical protein